MNSRSFLGHVLYAGAMMLASVMMHPAHASVVIAGTRVIYNQKDPEVTVRLSNEGGSPALVQAWIDKGNARAAPSTIDVPFTVTPPVSRIDPGKGQTLRIIRTGEVPANDHESVYWLNVLEIPPKVAGAAADANKLQLAFRSRIKLFYRPAGLSGRVEDAPAKVTWQLTSVNGKPALQAHNPGAYNVSFSGVDVVDGANTATFDDGGMVRPGQSETFPLKGTLSNASGARVHYHAINDYGGTVEGEAPLQ
ncbi:fimbria/pilus periplasmic chaperone [Paraburkholderia antibiotica]|uniref:Fimbria/pilus periplasmic chaperone n=1 Tax=Paraburkholderia antibiotica TaxID=2728839 RepID=A0A7X9ZZY3_9BURK|nr:fimbria/pilus periplasmic chaperone [Paraburkholderia antibiotica]NML33939.1 fimbria/pilus periplasmic chaperone [Paraburkholderia antibiotica]